jgi:hypothetical protein
MQMNFRLALLVVATSVPSLAFAQAYKCKQTDGSLSFQDHPCAIGSVGAPVTLRPTTGAYVEPADARGIPKAATTQKTLASKGAPVDSQRQLADEQTKAQNEQILAHNRMLRCNLARQQLGILKESRPVYSYDSKGERVYVKDENRTAQVSSAERRVAEECN